MLCRWGADVLMVEGLNEETEILGGISGDLVTTDNNPSMKSWSNLKQC
jgi:hypothetical protein